MTRCVVVCPGVVGNGILGEVRWPELALQSGRVQRLRPLPVCVAPEVAFFGLDPRPFDIRPGPVMVSALRQEPPPGSTLFHLTLGSVDESGLLAPVDGLSEAESDQLMETARRLDTETLTVLKGLGLDHALVWEEGSLDLGTVNWEEAQGKPCAKVLPEGDGERLLRRFVDDSVNILSDHEVNRRRSGEGQMPANILWPWGHGRRVAGPNLSLLRGQAQSVESPSLRWQGLAPLFGLSHRTAALFGKRLDPDLEGILSRASGQSTVVYFPHIAEAAKHQRWDVAADMWDRLVTGLLTPLWRLQPGRTGLVLPGETEGLAITVDFDAPADRPIPFDDRVLSDPSVDIVPVWAVAAGVLGA